MIVRQLYFGRYRLVFHVAEAADDKEEGTVIVRRVLYGAQSLDQPSRAED